MFYQDKVVWITGASSGTGEALVYEFFKNGAKLIISARRENDLIRVKNACNDSENRVFVLPLDLENHDELPSKAEQAIKVFGRIDILFNNGGISQRSLAENTIIDVDKKLMNINYFGSVIITKAVIPFMIKQKSGHIAVMSSLAGKFSIPLRTSYSASKHALHGFFDGLRAELYQYNIKVTIICSGYIKTEIAKNALTQTGEAQNATDPGIENGMSPEYFAKKSLKAIKSGKFELLLGGKEKIAVYLKRFFPKILASVIRKTNVR
jgi:short-subunit dehydrogenase